MREKVAFSPDKLVHALQSCPQHTLAKEIVILSTCNRTELYVKSDDVTDTQVLLQSLFEWLADFHKLAVDDIIKHSYTKINNDAIAHLMSVACGLDSLIVGEPQILGQVKQAFNEAKHAGQVGTEMERLFDATFSVAKKVRTETEIGANAVSVAFAAVQLARQIFSNLSRSNILLIGAGETIELAAKHLIDADAKRITVANRTLQRAQNLADKLNGEAITISQIPEHLAAGDIVISSTASSLPLIGQGMVERAIKSRKHQPMLMIDLAVPRDIEAEVDNLDDVFLYTVDDLQNIVEQNVANREAAAQQAHDMIATQIELFTRWQQSYQKVDLIKMYREKTEETKQLLVAKALKQIGEGAQANEVIEQLAFKLSNTLMHGPTKALQAASKENNEPAIMILSEALGLDKRNHVSDSNSDIKLSSTDKTGT